MYKEIIDFWFDRIDHQKWWEKDPNFDNLINARFGDVHRRAASGELFEWRVCAQGSLAEIIVLDQFSRNIFRNKPESFLYDSLALILAQTAISRGFDFELSEEKRSFLYLPFMHSESKLIHLEAVTLYTALGNPQNLEFELKHKAIIDQFGRYPHRNEILGRISTSEELEFLKQTGSSF